MRHIIPISGKDSCATAIVQMERKPDLPYELFFNDVGSELPETYAWLDNVEKKLNRKIHRVGKSLEQIILDSNFLPSPHARFCTRLSKIEPMEEWIGEDEATIYFGIRADENRGGYKDGKDNITVCYPLKEVHFGLSEVYSILDERDLRPPRFFWKSLYERVMKRLWKRHNAGFRSPPNPDETIARLPPHVFDMLFAWRSRSNCFFCFFQNLYEWVGLLEHHPDLFDRAEHIELSVGGDGREKSYSWIEGYPLSLVRQNRETIIDKRAEQIIKQLTTKRYELVVLNALSVSSCGLLCGK